MIQNGRALTFRPELSAPYALWETRRGDRTRRAGEINQSVVGPYLSSLAADMGLSSVATELILDRAEVAIVWDVEIVKLIGVGVCEKGVFSRGRRHSSWYAPSSTSLIRTPSSDRL